MRVGESGLSRLTSAGMNGIGARMKARARELSLSDTRVAERAGLAQTRYAAYTVDRYEPDLATLLRICRVLHLSPNDLFGWTELAEDDDSASLRRRIIMNLPLLEPEMLNVINTIILALAAKPPGPNK